MKVFVSIPQHSVVMKTFMPKEIQEYFEKRFEVIYSPLDRQLTPEEIPVYAKAAEAIVTGWGHPALNGELLKQTAIKLIVHTGGSVGSLVEQSIYDSGIRVISGNDLYADSVAEGVLAYMLTALRNIPDYINSVRDGSWRLGNDYTEGLLDQTVGIVGLGAISTRVMKLLQPFNVKIKIYSSYPVSREILEQNNAVQVSLDEIFSTCKIVSIHSAMNERNRGLIGKEHFNLLKDGAVFVNTARGRIIREEEMIEALKEKRFKAILDVFYQEPIAADSELRKLPNVYCVPHMAGPTWDRRPIISKRLADDIVRFADGEAMKLEISAEYAARMTVGG